jgi:hypothetical protein
MYKKHTSLRCAAALVLPLLCGANALADDAQPAANSDQDIVAQPAPPPRPEAQPYVGQFLVYTGFMFLNSPAISLMEPGIHFQLGMRWSRHISVGLDYSRGNGDTTIPLSLATTALQNEVNPLIASAKQIGIIPQNYQAGLPIHSTTQSITGGPEFPWRRWSRIIPYIRPSCGFILEDANVRFADADFLTKALVKSIVPSGMKTDTAFYYGFGGGVAFMVTKHFGLVVQADFVHDHLFADLLQNGRNTVRFSVGPGYQFGHNVTRKFLFH